MDDYILIRVPRSRYVATLTSFGSAAANKFVLFNTPSVSSNFTLQGNNGAWVTIATDQYEVAALAGYVVRRGVDDSGNLVDWSTYEPANGGGGYRATYTVDNAGTRTPYTNESLTFADDSTGYSPIGSEGQVNVAFAKQLVATYLMAAGGNVVVNDTSIRLLADAGTYIKWATAANESIGEMWAGYAAGFGTQVLIGRGKDVTYPSGAAKLQAYKYDNSQNTALTVGSYGSATLTGPDATASQLVTRYTSDFAGGTTVQNTVTETTIYSATIKGGALSSAGIITAELGGDLQNNSGGAINLTFKVKYGGTTMSTMRVSVANFTGTGGYFLRTRMGNTGTTNSQRNFAFVVASKNGGGGFSVTMSDYATAAVDSTSDQTFAITVQWASADPSAGVFSKGGLIELSRTN
jgi:hypothetical protein